jgi:hypothetical protein
MTAPDDDLLVAPEGVDEGSAASTAESAGTGGEPSGVLGPSPRGGPEGEDTPRPPDDVETEQTRDERAAAGPGQQVEAGEG